MSSCRQHVTTTLTIARSARERRSSSQSGTPVNASTNDFHHAAQQVGLGTLRVLGHVYVLTTRRLTKSYTMPRDST